MCILYIIYIGMFIYIGTYRDPKTTVYWNMALFRTSGRQLDLLHGRFLCMHIRTNGKHTYFFYHSLISLLKANTRDVLIPSVEISRTRPPYSPSIDHKRFSSLAYVDVARSIQIFEQNILLSDCTESKRK